MTPAPDIDAHLAVRVHARRVERSLTLTGLADRRAGSGAMPSRLERGESSPMAQLLARICRGITIAALSTGEPQADPVARRAAQAAWRDPASGYLRPAVSPAA